MKQFVSAVVCCLLLIVGLNFAQSFAASDDGAYDVGADSIKRVSKQSSSLESLESLDSSPSLPPVSSSVIGDVYDHAASEARFSAVERRIAVIESQLPKLAKSSSPNTVETLNESSTVCDCPECLCGTDLSQAVYTVPVQSRPVVTSRVTTVRSAPVIQSSVVRSRTFSSVGGNVSTYSSGMVCDPATGQCSPVQSRPGIFGGFFRR